MVAESMASTAWGWVLASSHQPGALVTPSQEVAAGSCAQATRPGLMPKAVPMGEFAGSLGVKGDCAGAGAGWAWSLSAVTAAAVPKTEVLRKSRREAK